MFVDIPRCPIPEKFVKLADQDASMVDEEFWNKRIKHLSIKYCDWLNGDLMRPAALSEYVLGYATKPLATVEIRKDLAHLRNGVYDCIYLFAQFIPPKSDGLVYQETLHIDYGKFVNLIEKREARLGKNKKTNLNQVM